MRKSIDFEWYKVFYEVALRGSVSGAASDLSVSQPAVSQSIRNLEQAFGVRLFRRRSRGVELTDTGRELYSYVRESYRLLKLGERTIYGLLEKSAESILVAAPEDLGSYLLTPLFTVFRERFPEFLLQSRTLETDTVIAQVEEGSLAAGFISLPARTGSLEVLPFTDIKDVFVVSPSSMLLKENPLLPELLCEQPVAAPPLESAAGKSLQAWLGPPRGWSPVFVSSNPEGIRRFAAAGLGVGFMPEAVLGKGYENEAADVAVLETSGSPGPRRGAFVYRSSAAVSAGVRLIRDLLHEIYLK